MDLHQTEIRIRGRNTLVPSIRIQGQNVIRTGGWLKRAAIQDEELVEGEAVSDPAAFIHDLRTSALGADLFTFAQKLPETDQKYSGFHVEWENFAIVPITTYQDWWDNRAESSVRRAVRKAAKSGVVVNAASLDDAFVRGIVSINNETPIRQGRRFWHYGKSPETVRQENETYSERNIFLGAYCQGEMIGFMRITTAGTVANIVQLLSMIKHYDCRPANALIARAVEECAQRGLSYLLYYNYVYNDPNSSLTEFKRRNGFERVLLPRYYVPLTWRGRLAIQSGLHQGIVPRIPRAALTRLLEARRRWYAKDVKTAEASRG